MARKYHQGMFTPENPKKYTGDVTKIVYRSSWERSVMRWLDANPAVKQWSSEEIYLVYQSPIDPDKTHRYFVDFMIEYMNGEKVLVEIKPEYQTKKPKFKRDRKKFLTECAIWAKNLSKWKTAIKVARDNNIKFEVWTEKKLHTLGIRILR